MTSASGRRSTARCAASWTDLLTEARIAGRTSGATECRDASTPPSGLAATMFQPSPPETSSETTRSTRLISSGANPGSGRTMAASSLTETPGSDASSSRTSAGASAGSTTTENGPEPPAARGPTARASTVAACRPSSSLGMPLLTTVAMRLTAPCTSGTAERSSTTRCTVPGSSSDAPSEPTTDARGAGMRRSSGCWLLPRRGCSADGLQRTAHRLSDLVRWNVVSYSHSRSPARSQSSVTSAVVRPPSPRTSPISASSVSADRPFHAASRSFRAVAA